MGRLQPAGESMVRRRQRGATDAERADAPLAVREAHRMFILELSAHRVGVPIQFIESQCMHTASALEITSDSRRHCGLLNIG
jgi:hypothetical protein